MEDLSNCADNIHLSLDLGDLIIDKDKSNLDSTFAVLMGDNIKKKWLLVLLSFLCQI